MSLHEDKSGMGNVREVSSESSDLPPRPTSTMSKVKTHFRRFWWAHLIFFLVCLLIIVLCLVFVAFPKIAQDDMNASTLKVNSLSLTNPTSQSFHLRQNSTIGNPSTYHPRLDAFNATLALAGQAAYATIEIPKLHATKEAISIVDQDVTITDLAAFTAYNVAVLNQEEVQVDVRGRTGLHEMKLPTTHVDYRKTVTIKGLNKFSGFNVTSFSIELEPEADGTNMVGEVLIPNPSDMTLTFGNVTFANSIPGQNGQPATPVGNTTLTNLVLVPGDNRVPMRSVVDQAAVIGAIATTFQDGLVPIDILGLDVVYDTQHLTYFETAMRGLTQHVVLDVGNALKEIGVDPKALATLGRTPPK